MTKPNCYTCVHRATLPGSAHSRCNNPKARAEGSSYGIKQGWFFWPFNFDPIWLESCTGHSENPEDKMERDPDPLFELLSMLR